MHPVSNRCWPVVLAAVLVTLLSLIAGPSRVLGEDRATLMVPLASPATSPNMSVPSESAVTSSENVASVPDVLPSATPSSAPYTERPGYWVVSTRQLPQGMDNYLGPPCFEYYYRGDCQPLKRSNRAGFQSWIQPDAPLCIMIHGSFVNFRTAVSDAERTYRWLKSACPGRPLQLVFMTWPSDESLMIVPAIGVTWMGQRAGFNGIYLSQIIDQIPPSCPLSLLGHSHGARVTAAALHYRAGGKIQGHCRSTGPDTSRRIRTIFIAAAVEHHWFNPGERYDRCLYATEMLINLRNRKDLALGVYPVVKPFATRTLARSGFSKRDRSRLGHLNCRTYEIDVTNLVGMHHIWMHYTKHASIGRAITPYMCYGQYRRVSRSNGTPEKPRVVQRSTSKAGPKNSARMQPASQSSHEATKKDSRLDVQVTLR